MHKFTKLLKNSEKYLSPTARRALPVSARTFGIAAGALVVMALGAFALARRLHRPMRKSKPDEHEPSVAATMRSPIAAEVMTGAYT